MEMLKESVSPTALTAFKLLEEKRVEARRRQAEYEASAATKKTAAEAKRARKRAKKLALIAD